MQHLLQVLQLLHVLFVTLNSHTMFQYFQTMRTSPNLLLYLSIFLVLPSIFQLLLTYCSKRQRVSRHNYCPNLLSLDYMPHHILIKGLFVVFSIQSTPPLNLPFSPPEFYQPRPTSLLTQDLRVSKQLLWQALLILFVSSFYLIWLLQMWLRPLPSTF